VILDSLPKPRFMVLCVETKYLWYL